MWYALSMKICLNTYKRVVIRYALLFCASSMLVFSSPKASYAALTKEEEAILLQNFTRSMIVMYVASQMCRDTLKDEAEKFATVIHQYLTQFYPKGIGYWVLPQVDKREPSRIKCKTMLEDRLIFYQTSSQEFYYNFPEEPPPPILISNLGRNRDASGDIKMQKGRILPAVVAPRSAK